MVYICIAILLMHEREQEGKVIILLFGKLNKTSGVTRLGTDAEKLAFCPCLVNTAVLVAGWSSNSNFCWVPATVLNFRKHFPGLTNCATNKH